MLYARQCRALRRHDLDLIDGRVSVYNQGVPKKTMSYSCSVKNFECHFRELEETVINFKGKLSVFNLFKFGTVRAGRVSRSLPQVHEGLTVEGIED